MMGENEMGAEAPKWQEYLSSEHYNVPLHALRPSATKRLALCLDGDQLVHGDLIPNFAGLAELIQFDGLEIDAMERAESPTKHLLNEWKNRPDLKPVMGRLIEFLTELERDDVLAECVQLIKSDIQAYLDKPQKFDKMQAPIQDETVSQGPGVDELPPFLTRQDVEQGQQVIYDAFVCYNPIGESQKDLEFVRQLIARLEGPSYNFKLFVPWRDDLAGLNTHSISATIISQRCRHMIVVLSQNFLKSPACDFQSTFAHALSPGARNKRLVPIKIEDCPTPNILRIMACCDFTKRDLWDWSWDRLAKSIMIPLSDQDYLMESPSASMDGFIRPDAFHLRTSSSTSSLSSQGSRDQRSSSFESGFSSLTPSATAQINGSNRSGSPSGSARRNMTAPVAYAMPEKDPGSPMETEDSPNITSHTIPFARNDEPVPAAVSSQTFPVAKTGKKSSGFTGPLKRLADRMTPGGNKKKDKEKFAMTEC